MTNIPNCVPQITGNEEQYLAECVRTGWLSQVGPHVARFEQQFAAYHGVSSAVAVSSGTASIHLGFLALNVRPGDLVICPDMTFIGSVNPIRYCGALPVFLGVDPETLNLDPEVLGEFLEKETETSAHGPIHKPSGRRVAALEVVHLYGTPAEMGPIMDLARRANLRVLEDCAESLGARYDGARVGLIGDVGCFSFNGNKVITTGGGGMLISRDASLASLCKHLSTQAKTDDFEFIHDRVGFNYRLSNLCAAVGLAQMEHLDAHIELKRQHAAWYKELLDGSRFRVLDMSERRFNTYWLVLARAGEPVPPGLLDRMREIARGGIGVRPVWYPAHGLPAYGDGAMYYGRGIERPIYESTFCLPSSVGLTREEACRVADTLKAVF
ncbi:MAG: aminotransferase class I/II-fold pyridoxal phosphate-dependent enzyme [Phycisphaerae bacterium]|nr:aminotransferase class I/II-fold pyridoxal phosphate-dependent enzyme [Phycisphaerae bacterium]